MLILGIAAPTIQGGNPINFLRSYLNYIVSNQLTIAIYLMIAYRVEVAKTKDYGKKQKMSFHPAPKVTIIRGTHQRAASHVM
jgi:hypothetical protein